MSAGMIIIAALWLLQKNTWMHFCADIKGCNEQERNLPTRSLRK